jgi:hypothetical protein
MFDDILRQRSVIGLSSVCHRSVIGSSLVQVVANVRRASLKCSCTGILGGILR